MTIPKKSSSSLKNPLEESEKYIEDAPEWKPTLEERMRKVEMDVTDLLQLLDKLYSRVRVLDQINDKLNQLKPPLGVNSAYSDWPLKRTPPESY